MQKIFHFKLTIDFKTNSLFKCKQPADCKQIVDWGQTAVCNYL